MQEHTTTLSWDRVLVFFLWALVAALLAYAWYLMGQGPVHHHRALLVAMSGAALSALTATLHIKLYVIRVCALIRTIARVRCDEDGPQVRSIH